jgi:hypothetical protein
MRMACVDRAGTYPSLAFGRPEGAGGAGRSENGPSGPAMQAGVAQAADSD